MDHKVKVDTFVIITDSETNSDGIHPCQALVKYRKKMGIPARLVVVALTGTDVTIADPKDSGTLDIVGFDTAAPALIQQFSQGFSKSKGVTTEE
jgi:60 kDa SS-A/Ro ribonucleoprotein